MVVKVIGLDTAKNVFQVHGADASGRAVLRKRLRRSQVTDFFGSIAQCVVGLESDPGTSSRVLSYASPAHYARPLKLF
jgi:transposase